MKWKYVLKLSETEIEQHVKRMEESHERQCNQ
jgi:hypothetical protein